MRTITPDTTTAFDLSLASGRVTSPTPRSGSGGAPPVAPPACRPRSPTWTSIQLISNPPQAFVHALLGETAARIAGLGRVPA